jgi:CHAD domain-containing protein
VAKAEIQWDERRAAAANARRILPGLAADYFREVRGFLEKDREPRELHRMRLAAKRLRYTLELFRPCYGKGLEQRLAVLKELQDALGDVNDAVVTSGMLGHKAGRKAGPYLTARLEEKAAEFRRHWAESFDAPEREVWWTGYLRKSARSPGKKAAKKKSEPRMHADAHG